VEEPFLSVFECTVHRVSDVRQTEIQMAETSVFEMAIGKLKGHKSAGTDRVPAELIKAAGRTIRYEIHKLINSI
jgi:hypothetical protein